MSSNYFKLVLIKRNAIQLPLQCGSSAGCRSDWSCPFGFTVIPGNGKFTHTSFSQGTAISDELKEAVNYYRSNLTRITQSARFADLEMHLKATDINGIGTLQGLELAVFVSLVSGLTAQPVQT